MFAAGWGNFHSGVDQPSVYLRKAKMHVIPKTDCRTVDGAFCADSVMDMKMCKVNLSLIHSQ